VKSFLILFGAIAPPALLYAALSETDFVAIRELAPWALMLAGFGGLALTLRARERTRAERRSTLRRGVGLGERAAARSGALRRRTRRARLSM
jgi:hypothetical protein